MSFSLSRFVETLCKLILRLGICFYCLNLYTSVVHAEALNFDTVASDEQQFLPVEQAFALSSQLQQGHLSVHWQIASGYYLYQERISIQALIAGDTKSLSPQFDTQADIKDDPNFGKVKVFHEAVGATLDLPQKSVGEVLIRYQGCSQAGLCYPEQTVHLGVDAEGNLRLTNNVSETQRGANSPAPTSTSSTSTTSLESADAIASFLQTTGFWGLIGTFLLLGIGLSLTPCVLPMVPILSGIIAGQGNLSARRGFGLALAYVVGMSVSYALAGTCVGYFGASANLSAWLQNPWVLSLFAGIFVLLALSMFGFYELQLPSVVMNRLNNLNQQQQGGRFIGVALMGMVSALVVSPCVSAPLAGALIYIGTTGNALLGGLALFALGMGMGVPLLLIGLGAGALVPKSGGWMLAVKSAFGVLLLAVALWMLNRFVPGNLMLVLWALLLLGCGIALGAFEKPREGLGMLWRTLGFACVFWASLMLVGAATGSTSLTKPLANIATTGNSAVAKPEGEVTFHKVTTNAELQALLDKAHAAAKPVLIDYYADWCTACLDMARTTFADTRLRATPVEWIQVDITQNTPESTALLKRFGLFAPPSLVFFNRSGAQEKALTIMGEVGVEPLLAKLTLLK